jgi:ribonuclease HI
MTTFHSEEKTMTLKSKINEYKNSNPSATIGEIAKACNTSKPYVYQCINNYKKPKKSKAVKQSDDSSSAAQLNRQVNFLAAQVQKLRGDVAELEAVAKALRQQNRGLANVITYLESKLGIDEIDARLEATKG